MTQRTAIYVRSAEELASALERLGGAELAVDTEFMRESTYYPRLCLLQVANSEICVVIDALEVEDLTPLLDVLHDPGRLKALHAARQDLEVLLHATGEERRALPEPLFDTQVAAALIGLPAQIGYADLVARRLGVQLAKGHTRTDWSKRPLSEAQLSYAADDVRWLVPLYEDMRAELQRRGRLGWLAEEMSAYLDVRLYQTEPAQAWRRFKGLDRMRPMQRAAIKLLAEWREALAIKHDKPRGWILADDALRELSERLPQTPAALGAMRCLPPAVARKRGAEILALIAQAPARAELEAEATEWRRPEPQQVALVSRLMSFIRSEAERLEISPEFLATRRDVERLVFSGRAGALGRGWREEVIGRRLIEMAAAQG